MIIVKKIQRPYFSILSKPSVSKRKSLPFIDHIFEFFRRGHEIKLGCKSREKRI